MNENNFNTNFGESPSQPVQPSMGMNPSQPVQPSMGMNPSQPVQPSMGMNPGQPVHPNIGMNVNQMHQQKKGIHKKTLVIIISAVVAVALIIVAVLLLTGSKTLKCTMEESLSGMEATNTIVAKFKNDRVDKVQMKMAMDLGEMSSYKDMFISSLESQYEDFEEEGMTVKVTSDDTHVFVEINADEKSFKDAGYSTSESYKEVKEDLESQGFSCK